MDIPAGEAATPGPEDTATLTSPAQLAQLAQSSSGASGADVPWQGAGAALAAMHTA